MSIAKLPLERSRVSRRTTLRTLLSSCAVSPLLAQLTAGAQTEASPLNAKAKRVIFLFMNGGPSQIDTFDPKPALTRLNGKQFASEQKVGSGDRVVGPLWQSPFAFQQYGQSGLPVSELFPHIAGHADDLCVIRSLQTRSAFHGAALLHMNTGRIQLGHPSLGSWAVEGVGRLNAELPDFIVMPDTRGLPVNAAGNWSSQGLSPRTRATVVRDPTNPLPGLLRPSDVSDVSQQRVLAAIRQLNALPDQQQAAGTVFSDHKHAFELAVSMQSAAPGAFDVAQETSATQQRYGLDRSETRDFGTRCLMARRLLQHGVKFVQIYSGSGEQKHNWDGHTQHVEKHRRLALETDQPIAALLGDLKETGLLEETVVVWGGEFGRTPTVEGSGNGRDHNPHGFTMWLSGAGVRSGQAVGATDEVGFEAVESPYQVSDLHATVLHLLGLDHQTFVRTENGVEQRLTGPEPCQLITEALA